MSTNNHNTKLEFVSQCQTCATGVLTPPDKTLTVSEQALTKAACAAPLQAFVAAAAQTASDKAAYTKSVHAEKAAEAAARAMFEQLKPVPQGRYGKSNPILETTYGIPPVKAPRKTVAVKAEAIAKSATTRAANHTMGPKQKKAAKQAPAVSPASPTVPPGKPGAQS